MVFKQGESKWETPDGPFYTALINNHAIQNTGTYRAQLWRVCNYTVSNKFLNGGSGGVIKIDEITHNAPYSSTVLEADQITFEAPPQEQTVNGRVINYYFLNWENGNTQNPRTITPNGNFMITTNYKGHLVSSTNSAITYNNQRKMVYDGFYGRYHLVYEDNGEIYYTYTTGTDTWAPEIRLSDGQGGNKSPSIAADNNGRIMVVWQQDLSILMRLKTESVWGPIQQVYNMMASKSLGDATPVVSCLDFYFHIVWQDFSIFNGENLKIIAYDISSKNFDDWVTLSGTNTQSRHPSVASDGYNRVHIAWEENGKIYYSQLSYRDGYNENIIKEEVSAGSGYSNHKYPSITTDGSRRPNILWQAYSGVATEMEIILHARRSGSYPNEWSYNSFLGNDDYYKPTVTGFPGMGADNNELRGVWYRSTNMLWIAQYDGNSWSDFYQWLDGYEPNISANMSNSGNAKMVFRKYSSTPFILKTTSQNLNSTQSFFETSSSKPMVIKHHRRGVIRIDSSTISFELGEIELDGKKISLYSYPDSLIVGKDNSWEALFRSEVFEITNRNRLHYYLIFELLNREAMEQNFSIYTGVGLQVEIVNADNEKVLSVLDTYNIYEDSFPVNYKGWKEVILQQKGKRRVFLRVSLIIPSKMSIKQSLVEVLYLDERAKQYSFEEDKNAPDDSLTIPEQFSLEPNYPNPFNPQTTLAFDLPVRSRVRLQVFDVLGREVARLVDGRRPAGRYEVSFDATGLPSGVYIYRLHVVALEGKPQSFEEMRKMLLVK